MPPAQRPGPPTGQAAPQYQPYPGYPGYPGLPAQPGYPAQPYYGGQNGYAHPQPYPPRPGYYGYPPYAAYPGYYGYYGYPPYAYPYPWQMYQRPKRDGYLLGLSITAFAGSILALLCGLGCVLFVLLIALIPSTSTLGAGQKFGALVEFIAFSAAGILGGSFGLYHSIRSLFLKKPSADFRLPWFWIFLALYLAIIGIGAALYYNGRAVANEPLTIVLIALAGIFPALTIIALGVRRLHFPRLARWPTSWRRFTLALVSGSTLAILLALIFELILSVSVSRLLGVSGLSLDNPDQPLPADPRGIIFMFLLVSVIAPLVEETVKPLAVVIMMGRIRSAAEAFVLGLGAGVGFDLIETSGYISAGYRDWLDVALQRSTAGLLHGFGAAMVSLGWYYLTHKDSARRRFLLGFGCIGYAVLQHAIWNGSFGLQLLPAPIGPYLDNGTIALGKLVMPSFILVYIVLSLLMLIFFLFVTTKLRGKKTELPPDKSRMQPLPNPPVAVRA
jgi:RsiW-degrading membrane proteinase PrsW (M82 family)